MHYHKVQFTAGRSGFGYLEVNDKEVPKRLLDPLGIEIPATAVEYEVVDTGPIWLVWMILFG